MDQAEVPTLGRAIVLAVKERCPVTEIPTCPTCGRRPSQGTNASIRFYGAEDCDIEEEGCPDPIHDLADQGPALMAERDELRKQLQMVESDMAEAAGELRVPMPTPGTQEAKMLGANIIMRNERGKARIERDEARALVLKLFRRSCGELEDHDQGTEVRWLYDHMASSIYQEAQAALIAWGLVKREECVRG